MNAGRHVYLSPHFDDAVLSCGGAIHRQARAGESVVVVTICAGPPPVGDLSEMARGFHARWGNPADVWATRDAENRSALRRIGAAPAELRLADAIYRGQPDGWLYATAAELFGAVHREDAGLVRQIAAAVERVAGARRSRIRAPLGVGGHVDHQLTCAAAMRLQRQGWAVEFYEDYPYVQSAGGGAGSLAGTLAALSGDWTPALEMLGEDDLQAKVEGIAAYASQLPMLFGGAPMAGRVREYACAVGDGRPAERVWSRR